MRLENSALGIDAGAYLGYRFAWGGEFRMFADLTHIRELPYFAGGEVGIDTNDLTEFIWGGRFVWRPSYFHYHRPQVDY